MVSPALADAATPAVVLPSVAWRGLAGVAMLVSGVLVAASGGWVITETAPTESGFPRTEPRDAATFMTQETGSAAAVMALPGDGRELVAQQVAGDVLGAASSAI